MRNKKRKKGLLLFFVSKFVFFKYDIIDSFKSEQKTIKLSREKNMLFRNRRNCCCFNHPVSIWCPCAQKSCSNEVVNPVLTESFGFFNNVSSTTIAQQDRIPLNLVQIGGGGISLNGSGSIVLSAGTYQISYFASGTVPTTGTVSIKLRLNSTDVSGSIITQAQAQNETATLTQTIVINVPQDGAILEIVNNGSTTSFGLASMFIRRI